MRVVQQSAPGYMSTADGDHTDGDAWVVSTLAGPNPPGVERFLYVGDRYEPYINTVEGSRYIFLALEVHANGKVVLFPDRPWGLDDWPHAEH